MCIWACIVMHIQVTDLTSHNKTWVNHTHHHIPPVPPYTTHTTIYQPYHHIPHTPPYTTHTTIYHTHHHIPHTPPYTTHTTIYHPYHHIPHIPPYTRSSGKRHMECTPHFSFTGIWTDKRLICMTTLRLTIDYYTTVYTLCHLDEIFRGKVYICNKIMPLYL